MGSPRLILAILFVAMVWSMVQLFGRPDGYAKVRELQTRVQEQRAANAEAARQIEQLNRAIAALEQPGAAIEERARMDLGMVQPEETFFQVLDVAPPTAELPPSN